MDNVPILWQSKKQSTVATSTYEAEYIANRECIKKALWIRNILLNIKKPIKILTYNLTSMTTMENGEINNKLKHIEIKLHFNKDNIKNKKINLYYYNTKKKKMLVDPLTKDIN